MSAERARRPIRRILVAVDASPHSLAALEAAVELAQLLHADLEGLFVEDSDLIRASQLPFATEFGIYSARRQRLEPGQIEREMRALAGAARHALNNFADRAEVRHTFQVAQGQVSRTVLQAAANADLVTVGRFGWSLPGQRQAGSTTCAVLAEVSGMALVLEHGIRLGLPVLAVYDGSVASQSALGVAANLALRRSGRLAVAILADEADAGAHMEDEVRRELEDSGLELRCYQLPANVLLNLMPLVQVEGCGLLVVSADYAAGEDRPLLNRLSQMGCPVLVVH